jgi:hypothetical protein
MKLGVVAYVVVFGLVVPNLNSTRNYLQGLSLT